MTGFEGAYQITQNQMTEMSTNFLFLFFIFFSPRHNLAQQTEYATQYRQQWEQEMLQDPSETQDGNIRSNMSGE